MDVTLIFVLILLPILTYLFIKIYFRNQRFWEDRGVPCLKSGEIATTFQRLTNQISLRDFDEKMYERFKDEKFAGYMELGTPVFYVKDLDLLKRILVKDFEYFTDRRDTKKLAANKIFARMVLNAQGKQWKDLRTIMTPTFTTGKIKRMFQFFNSCGHHMVQFLQGDSEGTKSESESESTIAPSSKWVELDIHDCFGRYTMEAISSIAFGLETKSFGDPNSLFTKMAKKLTTFSTFRTFKVILLNVSPATLNWLNLSIFDEVSMEYFTSIITKNIERRRNSGEKRQDFLQLMLEAQAGQLQGDDVEEKGNDDCENSNEIEGHKILKKDCAVILDDQTILAQSMIFFFAGSQTIEAVLTFCSYQLALNPDIQERLAAEVIDAIDENGGELTYEITHSMNYLDMVISETLRLHPPGFFAERKCVRAYTVPDTNIVLPVGTRVIVPIAGIQRDEKYYAEPNQFNPDNFTAENKAKRHPYSWMPFGQGPRNCIAMRFALTEAKAALAHLIYNFELEPCDKTQIPLQIEKNVPLLKPSNGLWLKVKPRMRTSNFKKMRDEELEKPSN